MSFQSLAFLGFFIVAAPICIWVGQGRKSAGAVALLLASILAYGDEGLQVLALGVLVTYGLSASMSLPSGRRKGLFVLGVCYHVAVLMAFKYLGFFTGGAYSFSWAPTGLSFFTFSQIWYLKAVYDRTFTPVSWETLGLYGLFFPTVVSGPILSPQTFFPQLEGEGFLCPSGQDVTTGLYCFGVGLVKKVLLADQLALVVATGYDSPQGMSFIAAWLVILGFTLQLYLDFSGYCDMATGVARILGIRLPINFNSPYRATSITDFWKRWHITLTTFLRQCVYLPLGGNRNGTGRTYLNILIVFIISGFWHGAGWTFILWGVLHGLGQIAERISPLALPKWLGWCTTFLFVNLAWVLFRAPSLGDAMSVFRAAIGRGFYTIGGSTLAKAVFPTEVTALETLFPAFASYYAPLALVCLFALSLVVSLWRNNTVSSCLTPKWYQMLGLGLLMGWCILSFGGDATFIYANF